MDSSMVMCSRYQYTIWISSTRNKLNLLQEKLEDTSTIGVANFSQYEYELTFTYNFLTVTVKPHMVGKWTLDQWKALYFVYVKNKLATPKPRNMNMNMDSRSRSFLSEHSLCSHHQHNFHPHPTSAFHNTHTTHHTTTRLIQIFCWCTFKKY